MGRENISITEAVRGQNNWDSERKSKASGWSTVSKVGSNSRPRAMGATLEGVRGAQVSR